MKKMYNGFKIIFDESSDLWKCEELKIESTSLKYVQGKIDKNSQLDSDVNIRPKKNNVKGFIKKWGDDYRECIVTSVAESESRFSVSGFGFWVKVKDNRGYSKSKESHLNIITDMGKLNEINAIKKQIDDLEEKLRDKETNAYLQDEEILKGLGYTDKYIKELLK